MGNDFINFPLVSVVIPVYNRMNTIERAVNSVLNQTYKNIELIVVDDGSTDETLKIIKGLSFENMRVLQQDHQGANAARNLGITKAKGEYIAFQDSDDEWLPNKLEKQITYMLENRIEACYCPFFFCEGKNNILVFPDYMDKRKYEKDLLKVLRTGNVVSTQTLVIHKNIISDVGVFDELMPRYQDYEFAIRIIQKKKIGYVNEPLVKLYYTDNSISNDNEKLKEANLILLKKHKDFLDIEEWVKNIFECSTDNLDETELNNEVKRIDEYLNRGINGKKINVYKIAMDVLNHNNVSFNNLCFGEYRLRIERLRTYEFAIYGAGNVGKRIYRELLKKGLIPQCFLITKKGTDDELFGIPILELSQWEKKNTEIIIGVSRNLQLELIENLVQRGFMNYFRCPY